jgi:phenylacetate-CoA ligase
VLAGFDPGPEIRRSVRGQERHRPRLRRATRDLLRFARMREPARARAALEERLEWVRQALWRSPFYCASLRRAGLSPRDLQGLDDLRSFPLLDREGLRDGFAELPAFLPGRGDRLRVHHSSGSTAQPVTVVKDDYDSVHMWAVLRFWLRWRECDVPKRPRVALLCTLPHGVEYETPLPALGGGTLLRISVVRPEPSERLEAFRPHVLFTDPAGLHWLLGQTRRPHPRLVLSSAMHLSPSLRRRTEATLRAPVVNYYSTSETGPIAWECHAGRFHVLRPDVWVESVSDKASTELVVTRLRPSVVPLLRYRTGDRGQVRDTSCKCGHRGPSITGFSGRRACLFVTPQGREVDSWQLAWVFQHHPLSGFRLSQVAADRFRLETVGDRGTGLVVRLEKALVSLGWDAPQLEVRDVAGAALAAYKPEPFATSGSFARPR